jgi:hypothetical protein
MILPVLFVASVVAMFIVFAFIIFLPVFWGAFGLPLRQIQRKSAQKLTRAKRKRL